MTTSTLLDATLVHFQALVSFDTRNPPRAIGTDGIFGYLRENLPSLKVEVIDHGGAVSLYAARQLEIPFNVHLTRCRIRRTGPPIRIVMRSTEDRVIGHHGRRRWWLRRMRAMATSVLFTSDEEANDPRCIAAFPGAWYSLRSGAGSRADHE